MTKATKVPVALKVGLRPIRLGLFQSPDEYARDLQRQLAERHGQVNAKLHELLEQNGIRPGPAQWYDLSLALARQLYPVGFSDAKPKGQPSKWDNFARAVLAGEMLREREAGARSDRQAAELLSKREPWKSFLAKGKWHKPRKPGPDPAAPLLQQYKTLSARDRQIGEDAYQGCSQVRAAEEWQRVVSMLLEKSAG